MSALYLCVLPEVDYPLGTLGIFLGALQLPFILSLDVDPPLAGTSHLDKRPPPPPAPGDYLFGNAAVPAVLIL